MANIFSCTDSFGFHVVCEETRWFGHIVTPRPWMAALQQDARRALTDPIEVYVDRNHPDRWLFYAVTNKAPTALGLGYIRVVVVYRSRGKRVRAAVITAFTCQRIRQGACLTSSSQPSISLCLGRMCSVHSASSQEMRIPCGSVQSKRVATYDSLPRLGLFRTIAPALHQCHHSDLVQPRGGPPGGNSGGPQGVGGGP